MSPWDADRRPAWAQPRRLSRAWYPFGQFASLKHRTKAETPDRLRQLNITYAVYGTDSLALGSPRKSYELFARDVLRPP